MTRVKLSTEQLRRREEQRHMRKMAKVDQKIADRTHAEVALDRGHRRGLDDRDRELPDAPPPGWGRS